MDLLKKNFSKIILFFVVQFLNYKIIYQVLLYNKENFEKYFSNARLQSIYYQNMMILNRAKPTRNPVNWCTDTTHTMY